MLHLNASNKRDLLCSLYDDAFSHCTKVKYPSSLSISTISWPQGLVQVRPISTNCAPHSVLMTKPVCPALKLTRAWLISLSHSTFQPIDPSRDAHTSVNLFQYHHKVQTVVVKSERGQSPKFSSGKPDLINTEIGN